MKPGGPLKHFVLAFVIALILYAVAYNFIEHRRTRNGPWELDFASAASGPPSVVINEPRLKLTNVTLTFPRESWAVTNVQLEFSQPKEVPYAVPFGRCLFMDTTFQPGTLAFDWFGHEVQLLPRGLTIDHVNHAWQSGSVLAVTNLGALINAGGSVRGPGKAGP